MRTKVIELKGEYLRDHESLITPLVYTQGHGFEMDDRHPQRKTAAAEEALAFTAKLDKTAFPGQRVLHVASVGSIEGWTHNRKIDAFYENALRGLPPKDVSMEFFTKYSSRIPKEWGNPVFPTKFKEDGITQIGGGNAFHEHLNRFPRELLGKPLIDRTGKVLFINPRDTRCGWVLAAFWNDVMKRQELVTTVFEHKLPMLVRAIDEGFLPSVSMACDIPFDRCSWCGNLAPTSNDYCEHLRPGSSFRRTKPINSEGMPLMMINDFPWFFDLSYVKNPADIVGKAISKVASLEHKKVYPGFSVPQTPLFNNDLDRDLSNIGLMQDARIKEVSFSSKLASLLREIPLERLSIYLGTVGIYPTAQDLTKIMFQLPEKTANILGSQVELILADVLVNKEFFDLNTQNIKVHSKSASEKQRFDPEEYSYVINLVSGYIPLKSHFGNIKTASHFDVNLKQPLSYLSDEAKAVLLTRILLDREMMAKIKSAMHNSTVQWNLNQLGIPVGHEEDIQRLPIYSGLAERYIGMLANSRKDFAAG